MPKANNNNQAAPEEPVVVPVVGDDTSVPAVEVERTDLEPVLEPTAIVPNIVREINESVSQANENYAAAPQVLLTKGEGAKRVEIIADGMVGHKGLKKGDITDDEEYVALLGKPRGSRLVREVK